MTASGSGSTAVSMSCYRVARPGHVRITRRRRRAHPGAGSMGAAQAGISPMAAGGTSPTTRSPNSPAPWLLPWRRKRPVPTSSDRPVRPLYPSRFSAGASPASPGHPDPAPWTRRHRPPASMTTELAQAFSAIGQVTTDQPPGPVRPHPGRDGDDAAGSAAPRHPLPRGRRDPGPRGHATRRLQRDPRSPARCHSLQDAAGLRSRRASAPTVISRSPVAARRLHRVPRA